MEPIKMSTLLALLKNEDQQQATLDQYFELKEDGAFSFSYQLKEGVELIEDVEPEGERSVHNIVMHTANWISRKIRQKRYHRAIKQNPSLIRVVSEGDSWFQHPHPKVKDLIDYLMNSDEFAVYSFGAGGDELRNMLKEEEYLHAIQEEQPEFLLMSVGGNDILGPNFKNYIKAAGTYETAPVGTHPDRFLEALLHIQLEEVKGMLNLIFVKLNRLFPDLKIIIHGYSYIFPGQKKNKGWVGRFMIEKGMTEQADRQATINRMIDIFNDLVQDVASKHQQVHYIDFRKQPLPENKWYDEIHPSSEGYAVYGAMLRERLLELSERGV